MIWSKTELLIYNWLCFSSPFTLSDLNIEEIEKNKDNNKNGDKIEAESEEHSKEKEGEKEPDEKKKYLFYHNCY